METQFDVKQKIIEQLETVPNDRLNEIEMFIRFINFENKQVVSDVLHIDTTKKSAEDDFFDICGIWQDSEIDSNSLRQKAWRTQKW